MAGRKKINWTKEKIDFIIEKYQNKEMNTYELGKYFGCSDDTIGRRLKENGITLHKFFEDLTGKRFGKLTVLRKSEKSDRRLYWDCVCDCGKEICVKGDHLRQGTQLSCGCLSSKGEEKVAKILKENDIMYISQYKFKDFVADVNNIPYRFDFAIFKDSENLSYLIEYDGEGHYIDGWKEGNLQKIQERDAKKTKYCIENNIPLIRIPYTQYKDLNIKDLLLETSKFITIKGENND